MQSFLVPTRAVTPVITRVPDLGILPTSTPLLATATLAPTPLPPPPSVVSALPTPLPIPDFSAGQGGMPGGGGELPALQGAYVLDPRTLAVGRSPLDPGAVVAVDYGPTGVVALAYDPDPAHPGYGLQLRIGDEVLVGSPLPSATIRFTQVAWAPNGSAVAFVAETPGARGDGSGRIGDTPSDGLWVWRPDPNVTAQQTHHVLENRYAYIRGPVEARIVTGIAWAPDSTRLLVQRGREGGFPGQLAVIGPDWNAGDDPREIPHEDGSWSWDGSRILVSGMQTDVGPVLGWVDRESLALTVILDGRTQGLWMQDAVELADGRIAFLGGTYDVNQPGYGALGANLGLYLTTGPTDIRRVADIGPGPLNGVMWNQARTAVIVRTGAGRTLAVRVGGGTTDVSAAVGNSRLFWAE